MATRTTTYPLASTTAATASLPTATTPKMRQYKDFLTPSMHRRFTNASLAMLAVCYVEAAFMSSASLIWRFLPIGMTGVRTLLLFLPVLAVFVIRLSRHHIGERNTTSGLETAFQLITSKSAWLSLGWYLFSAYFFGEVFIWSKGAKGHLGWVDEGRSYERPRLNENPILLRTLFGVLAVAQAAVHWYFDYDGVTVSDQAGSSAQSPDVLDAPLPEVSILTLSDRALPLLKWCFQGTILSIATIGFVYFVFVRRFAWESAYWIGSTVLTLPYNSGPPGLTHAARLIWQAFSSSLLLLLLWETSNVVFTFYISQPPTKKGYPLTGAIKDTSGVAIARSEDPNGSLLAGLKSKKELPKSFALWELYLICTSFPSRRKSLFKDVERAQSSTWQQVSGLCLAELEGVRTRIQVALAPADGEGKLAEAELQRRQYESLVNSQQQQQSYGLPKIANKGVTVDPRVAIPPPAGTGSTAGNIAKSVGQHPGAQSPLSPIAKKLAMKAKQLGYDRALTAEQRTQLSPQGVAARVNGAFMSVLRSPVGIPFRQPLARISQVAVFGVPNSHRINILHAVRSLTALVLASKTEDDYGQVSRDIPVIIRAFTATINDIQSFLAQLTPSWTDVDFDPQNPASRKVESIDEVTIEIKRGLEQILLEFGEYAPTMGLTRMDMRLAKEAVGKGMGSEMVKVR
ncbi:hypothetical protein B0A48_11060 [Cryoendolithus antarcticus]|uniref:Nucleoporin NDC1 n=1 Tax=Cryoendolithus antarcticus TaxID=1507870 RepID=A0A1V8SUV5_9PEZI|nr:hypothetical protein B0A48_11060 [Cryoendolithus antarcticus]